MQCKYVNSSNEGGVYEIRNTITAQLYIGSAKRFIKRFLEHRNKLRGNKHENQHLQNAWNKYGENVFIFNALVILENNELDQRLVCEQKFLDQYWESGILYNMKPFTDPKDLLVSGYGRKKSIEERKKISESRKGIRQHKKRDWTNKVQTLVDAFRNDIEPPLDIILSDIEKIQCRDAYNKWTRSGECASIHKKRKMLFKQWLIERDYFKDGRKDSWTRKSIQDQENAKQLLSKYRDILNLQTKAVKRV